MKTTILSLVLASIVGLMYCSEDSLAVTQAAEDKELRALLEARRDTLEEVVAIIRSQKDVRQGSIFDMTKVSASLLEAELEAAGSQEEAIESYERALEAQAKIEQVLMAMEEFGGGSREELLVATAARMKAEIDLYKAKKGNWPVSANRTGETAAAVQRSEDKELRELLEARRHTLGNTVKLIAVNIHANPRDLAKANIAFLEAELELARSQEERIASYEKIVVNQRKIEQVLNTLLEVGVGNRRESLNATAARINAETDLHQARKGQWPVMTESGRENPAVTQEPEDKELQTLMEARRDTLRTVVQFIEQQVATGTASVIDLTNANTKFLEAELQLAKSQDERIATFEKLLESQTELEREVTKTVGDGRVPRTELLTVTAARIKVEIDLYKAKKGI